jgi:hypothetical protein
MTVYRGPVRTDIFGPVGDVPGLMEPDELARALVGVLAGGPSILPTELHPQPYRGR